MHNALTCFLRTGFVLSVFAGLSYWAVTWTISAFISAHTTWQVLIHDVYFQLLQKGLNFDISDNSGAQKGPFIYINVMVKFVVVSLEIHFFDWMRRHILERQVSFTPL